MTVDDWVKIISAMAAAAAVILGAIGALWVKVHSYRQEVNGRMDQLLELTHTSSLAEGKAFRSIEHPASLPEQ